MFFNGMPMGCGKPMVMKNLQFRTAANRDGTLRSGNDLANFQAVFQRSAIYVLVTPMWHDHREICYTSVVFAQEIFWPMQS
jgi:hypothetical protein